MQHMQKDTTLYLKWIFLLLCFRDSAAVDVNKAGACFRALLQDLEQQWNRFAQESNILHGPDFPGIKNYLLVGKTSCITAAFRMIYDIERIDTTFSFGFVHFNSDTLSRWATEPGHNPLWMSTRGKENPGCRFSRTGKTRTKPPPGPGSARNAIKLIYQSLKYMPDCF